MSSGDSSTKYVPVLGYPAYIVGDDSTIFRFFRGSKDGRTKGKWRKVKPYMSSRGYYLVRMPKLNPESGSKSIPLHAIVAEAFHGKRPEGMQCRHIDGNKTNNHPSNLAWGTAKENIHDKIIHGTNIGPSGEKNRHAKLTADDVRSIRGLCGSKSKSHKDVAKLYGITENHVYYIVSRRSWKHVA